ncbi:hypothetical protein GCM10007424_00010 [Flavobacterium suaedae]|uniref:DUF2938 domain-containing protein n=1 Tax=Flavobacterium suaedae TaxID=1767027 RepID=A0ABQ1JEI0_9FLAO|nr:hypothetical protein [Flavobacterium suaedae]GGB64170.1 hypothetical protein GCM10007424_00010 [Flavobacterium suaedae]
MESTINKIIIAGVAGTVFMSLYSYLKSKKEKQIYVEAELLNRLIDKSENFPKIKNKKVNPYGWIIHTGAGILFVSAYHLAIKNKLLDKDLLSSMLAFGSVSGAVGIITWELTFLQHKNPPYNNRSGYYSQLFIAHIIFSVFATTTYNYLNTENN